MDWFGDVFFIISTHAPLAGRDVELLPLTTSKEEFQPTRPLRGATHLGDVTNMVTEFQPTRPLRGATIPLPF